jgi:hypothetical protein
VLFDVSEMAYQTLETKRAGIAAKALLRPALKQALWRSAENVIEEEWGRTAGRAVKYSSNIYNVLSEQADLRSWQTLPAKMLISRVFIHPGFYDVVVRGKVIDQIETEASKTYVVFYRSNQ